MLSAKIISQVTTPGTLILAPATPGRQVFVKSFFAALHTAGTLQFQDTDGNVLSGAINLAATPLILPEPTESAALDGWFITAPGKGLQIVTVTGGANGHVRFTQ